MVSNMIRFAHFKKDNGDNGEKEGHRRACPGNVGQGLLH